MLIHFCYKKSELVNVEEGESCPHCGYLNEIETCPEDGKPCRMTGCRWCPYVDDRPEEL